MRLIACVLFFLFLTESGTTYAITNYTQYRYREVIHQTDWYTCGPAALATLLTYYYGQPVTEEAITKFGIQDMASRNRDPREGFTLLTLRNAARMNGIQATGYKLDFNQLQEVLKAGLPVLVNTVQPEEHFSVVIALDGDHILLADPSWGLRVQDKKWFLDAWNGVTLILQPNQEQANTAKTKVQQIVTAYRERVDRLRSSR